MQSRLNVTRLVLSILTGITLILSAIDPTAAYASAPAIARPTQTPTATTTQPAAETATSTPMEPPPPTSETVTPTGSETPTAGEIGTLSATPTPSEAPDLLLTLDGNPDFLTPGGSLNVRFMIDGYAELAAPVLLRFYPPEGVMLKQAEDGAFNPEAGTIEVPITDGNGQIGWSADESVQPPVDLLAEVVAAGRVVGRASLVLPERSEFVIGQAGGAAWGLRGRVKVSFPAGALSERVKVKVGEPSSEALPVASLSGFPFELTAVTEAAGAQVTHFEQPVEIQVGYDEGVLNGSEEELRLFWYDPADGQWKPPLGQRVDTENNRIIATTDHFTVFDTYDSNWQSAETPTMEYFQTPGFTGAGGFSLPIKVPPGPGGFQPGLTLTYSSSVVDNAGSQSQASWVGMGWSLTNSYIEYNEGGLRKGSYQLNLNGMSVGLLAGANGEYHASDENFYKVEFSNPTDPANSAWTIWDKAGNQYVFDQRTYLLRYITSCETGEEVEANRAWRWSLSRVVNIYGQQITYSYHEEKRPFWHYDCKGNLDKMSATHWVYPTEIRYAHGRYRVLFERSARTDYQTAWTNIWFLPQVFQNSLLSAIRIEQDANGDGSFETLIRKYQFNYYTTPSGNIFPDLVWEGGGRTPTLASVQEFGVGGTGSLPPYTFYYEDGMHLTSASNGYGGTIAFTYNDQPAHSLAPFHAWHETIPYQEWHHNTSPTWGNPLKHEFENSSDQWVKTDLFSSVTVNTHAVDVKGVVKNNLVNNQNSFQPGRWYMAVASVKRANSTGQHTIRLGFSALVDGVVTAPQWGEVVPLTDSYVLVSSGPLFLSTDATNLILKMDSTGLNRVEWYYLYPLPTVSRVTARTLSAGGGQYTFTYAYEGAATNAPELSAAASGSHPYVPPYSEFRGHSQVTETDPYGKITLTSYNQDDCYTGRPGTVTIQNAAGMPLQTSTTDYACSATTSSLSVIDTEPRVLSFYNEPFDPIPFRWVRKVAETKTVYKADGSAESDVLASTYEYDTHGNQTAKTQTGGGVTLVTHTDYFPNESAWLVGLPARTWVTDGMNILSETLTLYDGANAYDVAPSVGVPTATRTLMDASQGWYSQTSMEHDVYGNVTAQTTWSDYGTATSTPTSGARTSYTTYDPIYHTYAVSTTDALGHQTDVTYDYSLGLPLSETDPNGAITSATYDSFGRFISLTKPLDSAPSLTVSYQNSPFVVTLNQVIDANHTFTVVRNYDGLGRQTSTVTNGVTVASTFDAYGRVLTQTMPGSAAHTTTTYDALGRALTVIPPDGAATTSVYNGLTTTVTDARGNKTETAADILGRTLSVTPKDSNGAPSAPNVVFTYDPLGNMKTATRGGVTTALNYDNAGRKLNMTDPDMGYWQYGYDALGNMTSQIDALNCTTALQYDLLNRPTQKSYSGCPTTSTVTYGYDSGTNGIGRRTSMNDGSGSAAWNYDSRGRMVKETKTISGNPFVTEWGYNSADLQAWMKYPDGEIVNTTYDNNMLPKTVIGSATYVSNMNYDSAGRITSRALGNGLTQTYEYYPWNQQGGRLKILAAGSLLNSTYVYDSVGNITTITDSINALTQTFGYDALDRLTSASASGTILQGAYSDTYQYDPATGNLKVKGSMTLDYLDSSHAHAVTNANSNTYSYDANGNQVTRHIANDTFNLIYDAENRLVEVKRNNTTIALFTFDGDGKRVKSVMNGETILFVGGHFEQKGSTVTKFYFAGATRIALRKYIVPQSMTVEYMLGDHLGSTSITTDTAGAKISELRYKAWGETRYTWTNAPVTTPTYEFTKYQFTGQYSYTAEFGLHFYGARFYDSGVGRFVSPDSLVPDTNNSQSWDRFAYVGNNPVKNTDPGGHCWPLCTMAIGALVSGGLSAAIQLAQTGTVDWKKVGIAAAAGAVAGLVGPAIVGLATATGAVASAGATAVLGVGIADATTIGIVAEIGTGLGLSAVANNYISAANREFTGAIDGEEVTWDSYNADMAEHRATDYLLGAVSYGVSVGGADALDRIFYPPQNASQNIIYSGMEGFVEAASNTDLLGLPIPSCDNESDPALCE